MKLIHDNFPRTNGLIIYWRFSRNGILGKLVFTLVGSYARPSFLRFLRYAFLLTRQCALQTIVFIRRYTLSVYRGPVHAIVPCRRCVCVSSLCAFSAFRFLLMNIETTQLWCYVALSLPFLQMKTVNNLVLSANEKQHIIEIQFIHTRAHIQTHIQNHPLSSRTIKHHFIESNDTVVLLDPAHISSSFATY